MDSNDTSTLKQRPHSVEPVTQGFLLTTRSQTTLTSIQNYAALLKSRTQVREELYQLQRQVKTTFVTFVRCAKERVNCRSSLQ